MLLVYLDTQDYINIFNEEPGGTKNQTLEELLLLQEQGLIQIGYSAITMFEFVTKPTPEFYEERRARGALVKKICGKNAFPFITDLPKGLTYPNQGFWIFDPTDPPVKAKDFRNEIRKVFEEMIDKSTNLSDRDKKLRKKWGPAKTLRKMGLAGTQFSKKIEKLGNILISEEIIKSKILERFVHGKCSDQEFENTMNWWLCDQEEFSTIYYKHANFDNMVKHIFGTSIEAIEKNVGNIVALCESIKKVNEENTRKKAQMIANGMTKREARGKVTRFEIQDFNEKQFIERLEENLGKGRCDHIGHYLNKIAKGAITYKSSDLLDLLQMCYAYDCDMFRCDTAMLGTFNDFEHFSGKLVRKFEDLPTLIKERIAPERK